MPLHAHRKAGGDTSQVPGFDRQGRQWLQQDVRVVGHDFVRVEEIQDGKFNEVRAIPIISKLLEAKMFRPYDLIGVVEGTILILTPVLMPLVKAAGIDPVYFGVLFIMNNAIGLVTQPVGTVLNVVAGVGKRKMDAVARGVVPFMCAQFGVLFLLVLFPQIVLWPLKLFY